MKKSSNQILSLVTTAFIIMRASHCLLVVLSTVAISGLTASASTAADKSIKPVQEWRGKYPKTEDEPLINAAPRSDYIADEKTWAKLWRAWRGKEELPKVDFEKQLVFVGTTKGAANDIAAQFNLNEKGDLIGGFPVTNISGAGFIYMIVVIDRAGVKTYNSKAFEKE